MSQIPCPKCGRDLVRPNPEQSLLSVCGRCGFSACMRDDIAAEYREEIGAERTEHPVVEHVTDITGKSGLLF
jgi:hypothetical protein